MASPARMPALPGTGEEALLFSSSRSNDHRPANSTLVTALCRRFRSASAKGTRFSCGVSKARNPSKLSEVTHPCAANSPKACSTREGNKPVRFTSSPKNSAPSLAKVFKTREVSGENSGKGEETDSASHSARFSLAKSATGLERTGAAGRPFWFARAVSRPQPTRPVKHNWSSHCGV